LVCGDVLGKLDQLFERVDKIQQDKGPFDVLFCIGKFFTKSDILQPYRNGSRTAPIQTFIVLNNNEQIKGTTAVTKITEEITVIQSPCTLQIAGLHVAFVPSTTVPATALTALYSISGNLDFRGIDILLSNDWPKGIFTGVQEDRLPQNFTPAALNNYGHDIITDIACTLIPRYHFATSDRKIFFERPPYRNISSSGVQYPVTRFLGLADAFNTTPNQRFLYAFTIEPILTLINTPALYEQPRHTTDFPYQSRRIQSDNLKRTQSANASQQSQAKRQKIDSDQNATQTQKKVKQSQQQQQPQQLQYQHQLPFQQQHPPQQLLPQPLLPQPIQPPQQLQQLQPQHQLQQLQPQHQQIQQHHIQQLQQQHQQHQILLQQQLLQQQQHLQQQRQLIQQQLQLQKLPIPQPQPQQIIITQKPQQQPQQQQITSIQHSQKQQITQIQLQTTPSPNQSPQQILQPNLKVNQQKTPPAQQPKNHTMESQDIKTETADTSHSHDSITKITTVPSNTSDCTFCLSSSQFEKHLVIALGRHFYLSLVKGGINENHVAIVSIRHTLNQISLLPEAKQELNKWLSALTEFFTSRDEKILFIEQYLTSINHLVIQVIPIPSKESTTVAEYFFNEGKNHKLEQWMIIEEDEDLKSKYLMIFIFG
jgi:hypothetical protein